MPRDWRLFMREPETPRIFCAAVLSFKSCRFADFNFERIGYIEYPLSVADGDTMFEEALNAGANEVISEDEIHAIETLPDDLSSVTEALEQKFGTPSASRLDWKPTVKSEITDLETAKKFLEFIDALEEDEDVQHVYHNAEISDSVMAELEAE